MRGSSNGLLFFKTKLEGPVCKFSKKNWGGEAPMDGRPFWRHFEDIKTILKKEENFFLQNVLNACWRHWFWFACKSIGLKYCFFNCVIYKRVKHSIIINETKYTFNMFLKFVLILFINMWFSTFSFNKNGPIWNCVMG